MLDIPVLLLAILQSDHYNITHCTAVQWAKNTHYTSFVSLSRPLTDFWILLISAEKKKKYAWHYFTLSLSISISTIDFLAFDSGDMKRFSALLIFVLKWHDSGAPNLKEFGNLPSIPKILAITCPYVRLSAPQANQCEMPNFLASVGACNLCLTWYNRHPYYGQLIAVKTGYSLTSHTTVSWAQVLTHRGHRWPIVSF